jgi:hypothetical protein
MLVAHSILYGGFGYAYILRHFMPRLRRHGVSEGGDPDHARGQPPPRIRRGMTAGAGEEGGEKAMARTRVLLASESWVSAAVHHKGWDHFGSVTFHLGAEPLVAALADSPFELDYMPAHEASERFPLTLEGLQQYRRTVASDRTQEHTAPEPELSHR